ncbi:MAG: PEP-CTERM sorting domain-containing protein [Mariniblastus sp.]|nr:PEP-CTERM sorting domain-containing protein [Mariniblastus sp.]
MAQQISPNPNPAGNTITVDTSDFFNSVGFANDGTISISERGQLTNKGTGRITHKGMLEIYGELYNADKGDLVNYSDAITIQASGHLENAEDATLGNGGTLSGQYEGLGEGARVGNFGGQDLFITYGGMGDGGGVALFTNAVPEPTTMLIWAMLAGLGMTTRRRHSA